MIYMDPEPTTRTGMRARFTRDQATAADIAQEAEVAGALAASVRSLVDAVVLTEVPLEELASVRAAVDELTARLRAHQAEGSYGVRMNASGVVRNWGNAVIGVRNAVAPPLEMVRGEGHVSADFTLGAAYEGPPGLVHGGVCALVLDQMLGEAAAAGGRPGMTATLTLKYREGTPLGPLHAEAEIVRTDGVKTIARGRLMTVGTADTDPIVCVQAEGLFILPRWARERAAAGAADVAVSGDA